MTQAAKYLIHMDQRAIDIALQYRFGSQAFKKIYDMSLARYRRLLMKKPYRNSGLTPVFETGIKTPLYSQLPIVYR
ncbi:AraC-like DNA-binding protein [Bacillus pumilus]|nr:AraC-like DNA-binding protein [Bacillus pumilus]